MTEPVFMRSMQASDATETLAGGVARVQWLPDGGAESFAEAALTAHEAECVSVFVTDAAGRYRAESYLPDGRAIQFCGHGALAAALHVFTELEPDARQLEFFNRRHSWTARRASSADADITLVYKHPELKSCGVPEFARNLLGASPIRAAEAGSAEDYLVLEFAASDEVLALTPNFNEFATATRRAIIVTARDNGDRGREGIVFRYFAPQYGQPEDTATGSAAVQLGAYWAAVFGGERFPARQLSAGGALMQLLCHEGKVELSARVAYRD